MTKKEGFFKELKGFGKNNPIVAFALFWVSLVPSLGSLILTPWAVANTSLLGQIVFDNPFHSFLFAITGMLLMGFALIPTTLFAGLSGFLFGWQAFGWVVLSYTLATFLGYLWGKRLSGDSLALILAHYPKAKEAIEKRKGKIGELIFFVRLSPIIPFALSNLLFALLKSGWKKLIIFGTVGMLPRTSIVFFSGTVASDLYGALSQESISGKGLIFLTLLILSIWGIWRFFKNSKSPQ